ncbi:MAG: hypothetical protein AUH85_16325 [Chloroflexi bacterium 13_1_40CM_4_68_4]|nr:MAG: hypothetical protein AUH85_16325 [Chloroflexi bacterium 13_1_40CM_4_68_4]
MLAVANPAGAALARQWAPLRDEARGVPRRVRNVRYSFAELIQIQHGSIGRDSGLPEGDGIIWMTAPDFEHNRIVITVDHLSAALLQALASRYGTEAIAIHVEPRRGYFGY